MKVTIGVSNHHVHLTEEDFKILFGEDGKLEVFRELTQPGQFASNQKVDIESPSGKISGLRILGPFRSYTQVEVSKTDTRLLKVDAPVRSSGDLEGAGEITIVGPCGKITKNALIIANRHIHITKEQREEFGLAGVSEVKLVVSTSKGGVFDHVQIKEAPNSYFEVHLDTDDANGFLIQQGEEGEIQF